TKCKDNPTQINGSNSLGYRKQAVRRFSDRYNDPEMGHLRAATAICVLLAASLGRTQSTPPAFDVASIKLHEFPPGMTGLQVAGPAQLQISGTRISTLGSLPMLVMAAYNRHLHEVSGGPQWTDREGNPLVFDIQARAEGDSVLTLDRARQMMQTLLAD